MNRANYVKGTYLNYALERDKKKLTDNQVSKATNVANATLSNWKKGTYQPKYDKMKTIADFLGISVNVILGE